MPPRVRKDVWKLSHSNLWDETLVWYAKAVDAMRSRSMPDPTSWAYQAAIHGYQNKTQNAKYWNQCQHFSWFFLPWHRIYLFYFEQIVAKTIQQLNGPADWSLPYWNYSDGSNPDARRLPPAFVDPTMPDGTPNPLRIGQRGNRANSGQEIATPQMVNVSCLNNPDFTAGPHGAIAGFGGPKTDFRHDSNQNDPVGALEATPHGGVHVQIGGFMASFDTAALDPIFWLHHSNIDRLWNVWLLRSSGNHNPSDPDWLTKISFDVHDENGTPVRLKSAQVLDSSASPLSYKYEDETDPFGGRTFRLSAARRVGMEGRQIPEMVGATEKPLQLTGRSSAARLSLKSPTGPFRATSALDAEPPRVTLHFENIKGSGEPTGYSVYLNLPEGAKPQDHSELFVGHLPMFGVKEATQADDVHSGNGLHYVLDIGDVIRTLSGKGDWNPENVRITLVPDEDLLPPIAEDQKRPEHKITIGRISVYHSL
jgi:tyrosinase